MPRTLEDLLKTEHVEMELNQIEWFILEKTLNNTGSTWKEIRQKIRDFVGVDIPDEEFDKADESLNEKLSEAYPF
jgi:uncharacterized protein (DUF736 family)